jgi:hypothetical protein
VNEVDKTIGNAVFEEGVTEQFGTLMNLDLILSDIT